MNANSDRLRPSSTRIGHALETAFALCWQAHTDDNRTRLFHGTFFSRCKSCKHCNTPARWRTAPLPFIAPASCGLLPWPGAAPFGGLRVRILTSPGSTFGLRSLAVFLSQLFCSGRASARFFFSSLATSTLAPSLALPHLTSYNRLFACTVRKRPLRTYFLDVGAHLNLP